MARVELIGHDEKQVDVLRLRCSRAERSEDHESREVASRPGDAIDAFEAQDQRLPPGGADAEPRTHLAQRLRMHTSWELAFPSQRWQRQDPEPSPMLPPRTRCRERQL